MNKNLFKTFAITAMAVLAGACAKEQVASGDGETVEMTFNVDVPETTITTKGLSDAAQVDELICQLFIKDGSDYKLIQTYNVPVEEKKASLKMTLVSKQRYYLAFWAQAKGTGYYNTDDLRQVTINYDAVKANEPKMDAFWKSVDLNLPAINDSELAKKTTITLLRAVAQVNFGAEAFNREDALKVNASSISMTDVPNKFNALFGDRDNSYSGSVEVVNYKPNSTLDEKLSVAGKNYDYLATAYVFAPKNSSLTTVSAKFTLSNGKSKSVEFTNVPIQRNMRTNILGNLLTFDATWTVSLDSEFKGGDLFYDPVGSAISKGGEVTLEDDFSVVPNSYGLVISTGVSTVLNLNGKKFENRNGNKNNKAALQVRGMLTINGDGDVICEGGADNNAVLVEDGGHLIINGGTYYVEKDANGKSNSTIYARKACTIEINGGVFSAEPDAEGKTPYVLNQADDLTVNCFSVKGGTFVGFNPADNEADGAHTNYVADGYHSTKVSTDPATGISTYVVTKEGVTPVVDQAGLDEAMANLTSEPATISLPAGNFSTYGKEATNGKTLTFNGAGAENTNFVVGKNLGVSGEGNADYSLENADVTFNDLTITTGDGLSYNYRGFVRAKSLTFVNCTIKERLSYWGGVVKFINCKFEPNTYKKEDGSILPDYNITTYQGTEFSFENCSFKSAGKFMNLYKEQNVPYVVRVKDCTFIATKIDKPVLNMKSYTNVEYKIYFEGTNIAKTEAGVEFPLYGGETASNAQVYVNNTLVWSKGQAF